MKKITGIILVISITLLHAAVYSEDLANHSLSEYLYFAHEYNPEIRGARKNAEASEMDKKRAYTLPDPKFSAGYFLSEVETRVGPQKGKLGLSQTILWPGKLAKNHAMTTHEWRASKSMLHASTARIFAEIRKTYAMLYVVGREIDIANENIRLLQHMESVLLSQYATSSANQASLLKLQVEMVKLDDKIKSLEVEGGRWKQKMRALLNADKNVEIPFPDTMPQLAIETDTVKLLQQIKDQNPAITRTEHAVRAAKARTGLARQDFFPDITLSTDYVFTDRSSSAMVSPEENGKNPWSIGASVTIPLWARSKARRVRKEQAITQMKREDKLNTKNMIIAEAIATIEEYYDIQRKIVLLERTLVPKAKQTLTLTEEAYRNGMTSVLDFFDAQRVLLDLEVSLVRQRAQRENFAATIDELKGGALSLKEMEHVISDGSDGGKE